MTAVETVRGPTDTAALGSVLMHEHVFVLGAEFRQTYPDFPDHWDEQARVDDAVSSHRPRTASDSAQDPAARTGPVGPPVALIRRPGIRAAHATAQRLRPLSHNSLQSNQEVRNMPKPCTSGQSRKVSVA